MFRSKSINKEDFELVRAAQDGDLSAFGELVKKYQQRIYSLAYGMTGNHSDADDLAQAVFLKSFRAIRGFNYRSSFYTWLYRVGVNTIITARKKIRARAALELKPELLEVSGSPYLAARREGLSPDRKLRAKELRRSVDKALSTLSPKHRAVVVMYDIEGISHQEIARILKCSEGTVRSRLHYARRELRKKLAHEM